MSATKLVTPSVNWFWNPQIEALDNDSGADHKRSITSDSLQLNITGSNDSLSYPQKAEPKIKFFENIEHRHQLTFRKNFMRHVKKTEINVVTLQDIKDVVFFLVTTNVPIHFIDFFHTEDVDHFLRALILYFQYYLEILEDVEYRSFFALLKLKHPVGFDRESVVMYFMGKLRYIIARDYARMILGSASFKKFHHMANKEKKSLSEKDILLFEHLNVFALRVTWIALMRPEITIIEKELNRLMRSDNFNVATKKGTFHGFPFIGEHGQTNKRILGCILEKKSQYLINSPLAYEIVRQTGPDMFIENKEIGLK